jgi:hypothetical protein
MLSILPLVPRARQAQAGGMGNILVLGDPPVLRPRRLGDRALARLRAASLDEALAAGSAPESSRLLAARAQALVAPRARRSVAASWERVLRLAHRARAHPAAPLPASRGSVPLSADQIVAAEAAIRALIGHLNAAAPVPARGVAMARLLLTDATSPVYQRHPRIPLATALAAAVTQLDPSLPLLPA